jgi:hypothetical protein
LAREKGGKIILPRGAYILNAPLPLNELIKNDIAKFNNCM